MVVQQRLAAPERILDRWRRVRRSPRHEFLDQVVTDVCNGAHSLGELDFAALCRARGLPEPTRQLLRRGPRGRVYLDVWWEELRLHVEIDGAQHGRGLAPVEDALRQNSVALDGGTTLRIPLLGLRVCADAFLDQVEAAVTALRRDPKVAGGATGRQKWGNVSTSA
jgi:very-short-patch-repair endonuclease